ncbi:40S ribosomal protein S5-1 [Hordeum vulgare]|nr:40S ribosomal protein S5-1 [Hordeum vulgare]
MHEGMLHIRDVEGPKKTESMEMRLEAMEQQVFKCQGMVGRELNANHMMITEFTNKHRIDANDIGKHLSRLYDWIDQLHAQIYDLQNQNFCISTTAMSSDSKDDSSASSLACDDSSTSESSRSSSMSPTSSPDLDFIQIREKTLPPESLDDNQTDKEPWEDEK